MDRLDPEALRRMCGTDHPGERPFVVRVLEMFLDRAPHELEATEAAARDGDVAALKAVCHRWRGTALAIGATGLAEVCGRIERRAPSADRAELELLMERLRSAYAGAERAIRREIDPGPPTA